MLKKVYIETSVVGAYFDERTDVVSVAQRYWTRLWWDNLRQGYETVVSRAVIDELKHPDHPYSEKTVDFIKDMPILPMADEIR